MPFGNSNSFGSESDINNNIILEKGSPAFAETVVPTDQDVIKKPITEEFGDSIETPQGVKTDTERFADQSLVTEPVIIETESEEFKEQRGIGSTISIVDSSEEFSTGEAISMIEEIASTFDGAHAIMFKEFLFSNLLYLLNFKLDKTDPKIGHLKTDGTISSEFVTHMLDSGQSDLKTIINDILNRISESERRVFPIEISDWVNSGSDAFFTVTMPTKNGVLGSRVLLSEGDGSYSEIEVSDINQDSATLTLTIPIDDKFDGYLILN